MISIRSAENTESSLNLLCEDGQSSTHQQTQAIIDHVHSALSQEVEEDHAREVSSWNGLPWWKRPSPYWVILGTFFSSTASSALLAPKVAMYTTLACRVHKPEYVVNDMHSLAFPLSYNSVTTTNIGNALSPHVSDNDETAVSVVSILLPNIAYTASSNSSQNETDSYQKCASDPTVQAVVARLHAVFVIGMGLLSCLTTGWWGSMSDRFGRRNVLFASVLGMFVADVSHVITLWFADILPGGYWFPLVGFLIDGLCGSTPSGSAVVHAYVADTTQPSTRSRYFAFRLGILYIGQALGPIIGGLLMRLTGTVVSAFYFASVLRGIHAALVLYILPESLTQARIRSARLRQKQKIASPAPSSRGLSALKTAGGFLRPLLVLLPDRSLNTNPLKRNKRDWNLFFVAIAYGLVMTLIGCVSYKFQYAMAQFKWTPEEASYYTAFLSASKALFLIIVFPLLNKYFKPSPVHLSYVPDEPLRGTNSLSQSHGAGSSPGSAQVTGSESNLRSPTSHSHSFDLAVVRISVGLDTASFLGMAVASTGTLFTLASVIASFTAGFGPAVQALALDIYSNRSSENRGQVGKLFGALSVIQALAAQIIGPALYGFVYFNTVAVFPRAIMIVSMCTTLLAFIFVSLVRIPFELVSDCFVSGYQNEDGNQNVETSAEILVATEDETVRT